MKIKTTLPAQFQDDELLTPTKVNKNFSYVKDAIETVASKRYCYSTVVLPFCLGVTAISEADNQATRSFLVYAPITLTVDTVFLDGALASGAATLNVYNASTGTTAPTGVANPIITPSTTSQTLSYTQSIVIPAGSTYRFELTGTAFTTSRLDLQLVFKSDRFLPASTDTKTSASYTPVTERSLTNATDFNTNVTALQSAVSANAAYTNAVRVEAYSFVNFATGTDADLQKHTVPLSYSTQATGTVFALYQHAAYASAGSVFNTVTATLANAAGSATGLAGSCNMNGVTEAVSIDTSPTVSLASGTSGAPSNTALDYSLTVANNAATNCKRSTVWLFIV